MRIIRNYILRECVIPFLIALGALTCVFLLGNLIQLAHMVINKGVSLSMVGTIFILYIPVLLGYTLPIACIVSVILAFSRLSADNEILALRASGIYLSKILVPLIFVGLILSLLTFILNDRLIPYAHHEQRQRLKNLGVKNPTAFLEPGIFITSFENQVLFIHKIIDNKLFNVTIYQPQPDNRPTRTVIAQRGEFSAVPGEEKVILKLIDGTSDEPDMNNPNNFYKLNFKTLFITLDLAQKKTKIDKKPKSMTLKELMEEQGRLEKEYSIDAVRLETEFFRRITWSFSPLIFILLGFPIAAITNKRGKTANVMFAIICAAGYYLLTLGAEALSIEQIITPAFAMWVPNIIAGTVALVLNFRLCRQ